MASENNDTSGMEENIAHNAPSSVEDDVNKLEDKGSGESEPKIAKTACDEETRNGSLLNNTQVHQGDSKSSNSIDDQQPSQPVPLTVIFNKKKYDLSIALSEKVSTFKQEIQKLTGVPPVMQKLIYKGAPKVEDSKTLQEVNITKGTKVMVVGSTLDDVLNLEVPTPEELKETTKQPAKEPICRQKIHQKILDKGVPEDAIPGIRNIKDALPVMPLSGMVNRSGGKVRLTFKLELDQIWIGTKDRTEKVNMSTIKNIISEPIEGHEEYHIMALQLGTTEASRYWIYWVPAQYVDAIKETVLGK
ncbi:ubiquitin domain-containing protein UBFD1-like isoform X2 [Ornithodoros turicata]|uniref:ubiquitin domain-containing protein UBFD1-like isoform X2 n=1 Tax=Ornithodoros turicata TaxID=34597 RepID=UPI003139353C